MKLPIGTQNVKDIWMSTKENKWTAREKEIKLWSNCYELINRTPPQIQPQVDQIGIEPHLKTHNEK